MKKFVCFAVLTSATALTLPIHANWDFDAGADLRIRQEIMDNVPQLPGGGLLANGSAKRSGTKNHMRYRPRVWAELKANEKIRVYTRLTDEFRWNVNYKNSSNTFPDELILDNLYIDGKGLFDGLFDFRIGRQDIYNLYGLDHLFVDGTPGDGSRTVYSDVARFGFQYAEDHRVDFFALHNTDDSDIRWGTDRSRHRSLCARGGGVGGDDWGYGAVLSGRFDATEYSAFAAEKKTEHNEHTEIVGLKVIQHLDEEFSLQAEGMSEFDHEWSVYTALNWKSAREGWRPFASTAFHYMSGEWDPMWARGVNDSELFLYGTHNGVAWWSNMIFWKTTLGVDFGRLHRLNASCGPMFAADRDGLGGDDGDFKGFLSQIRYDFPIWLADKEKVERFEIFGHVLAEWFNPGDYYATDKPAWFVRWQVEFRF